MKIITEIFLLFLLVTGAVACSDDPVNPPPFADNILIQSEGLFPEAFAYNESKQVFYAGSIRKGKVVKIDKNQNIETFVDDPNLKSILGMIINPSTNQLLICNADPGFSEKTGNLAPPVLAEVIAYDLETAEEVARYDFSTILPAGTPLLANDITLDHEGNAYVTNSLAPVVFKISTAGEMSIFLSYDGWAPSPGGFGLNGIEFHPDGFLILAQYESGSIYKVPLNDPSSFTSITLDTKIHSVDGIKLVDENTLIWVSNVLDPSTGLDNIIYQLSSTDDWNNAIVTDQIVVGNGTEFPTTLGWIEGSLFVIYSHLTDLMSGNITVDKFELNKVEF